MSAPGSRTHDELPPEINEAAADWIARLNRTDRTPQMETALEKWLKADPRHRRAWQQASDLWLASTELPKSYFAHYAPWHRFLLRRRTLQLSAALAALLFFGFGALIFYTLRDPRLTTDVGELRTITLPDGSRMTLNTATHLTVRFDERIRRIDLDRGEASFEVAKNPTRPFVVRAGDREVTALGTSFVVRREGARTAVTLVEGKVSVAEVSSTSPKHKPLTEPSNEVAILHPGERLTIVERSTPRVDRPSLEALTAWQRGRLEFNFTPLGEAVREMNRYSDRQIVLEDPEIAEYRVSGVFRTGEFDVFAAAIRATYSLRMREESGRIVLLAASGVNAESAAH